tara:strand:+ start:726 stop:1544 length:819 start_codon:yes stop_codon:yes gene_type:complete
MTLPFIKMHGLGNDFAIFDMRGRDAGVLDTDVIRKLSDRKTGIGCDQFIVLEETKHTDVFMRIFNTDGSQAEACGNAARCVGALLCEELGKDAVTIETVAGMRYAEKAGDGLYTVNMGAPRWGWQEIPLSEEQDTDSLALPLPGVDKALAVNVGNPHVVFFVENAAKVPLEEWGPAVENHALFPERTNVEFVEVQARNKLRMRVWERGAGVTRACGSGACAALVCAVRAGKTGRTAEIILDGGTLSITWDDDTDSIMMTGPVAEVFRGDVSL